MNNKCIQQARNRTKGFFSSTALCFPLFFFFLLYIFFVFLNIFRSEIHNYQEVLDHLFYVVCQCGIGHKEVLEWYPQSTAKFNSLYIRTTRTTTTTTTRIFLAYKVKSISNLMHFQQNSGQQMHFPFNSISVLNHLVNQPASQLARSNKPSSQQQPTINEVCCFLMMASLISSPSTIFILCCNLLSSPFSLLASAIFYTVLYNQFCLKLMALFFQHIVLCVIVFCIVDSLSDTQRIRDF